MKIIKPIVITFLVFASQLSYGQFLKKLKKQAERAVEEVVLRKTADKAAQMAEKGMDKIFNIDLAGPRIDPKTLPKSYDFEWKYTLQMTHKKGNMNMTYYLKPNAKYFGSQPELEQNQMTNGMFMIFDEGLDIMVILMENEDVKSGYALKNPTDNIENRSEEDDVPSMEDYIFKELGTKTILGYKCQGFQMENEELKMTMYVALDAPVSFNQVYGGHVKTKPKGFNPKWMEKSENTIVMEMDMVSKKKKKFSAKMTCIALKKAPKTITLSDYEFIDGEAIKPEN